MKDSVKQILLQVSPKRDWVDEILIKKASLYMVQFDLIKFQVEYPSLYATIRESIKEASKTHIANN